MLLAAVAAFVGASVQSATGFGFALVLSPALFAVVEPVEAVTSLLMLGFALNVLVLFEQGRPEHVDWQALAPVLIAAVPGLGAGLAALTLLSKEALQVAVGLAVIGAAGWQLQDRARGAQRSAPRGAAGSASGGASRSPSRRRGSPPPAAAWIVGFTSGALTTSISVSGPPVVLWLEARGVSPAEFRAFLAASFLALNLTGGALLLVAQGAGALDAGLVFPLLALVLAGYAVGAVAFRHLDRERFFLLALALVVVTGAASVAAGLGVI